MRRDNPNQKIYDFAGIGLGPFNLGLAALSHHLKNMDSIFLDEKKEFNWHPGMLLEYATLQVPFYADLVTLADPCNPFSYLNFLKAQNRLFKFAIRDDNYVFRIEYNEYCRWVVKQLSNIQFSSRVDTVDFDDQDKHFILSTARRRYTARKIVLGTGTRPFIPDFINIGQHKNIIHSSSYLFHKEALSKHQSIILIGSGQSAAEIFYDLLQNWHHGDKRIAWYTRSDRIFQMDTSPFCCELSTPDYIRHFFSLPVQKKASILKEQACLYKGINNNLLKQIYDLLYMKMIQQQDRLICIKSNCMLRNIHQFKNNVYKADLYNEQTAGRFTDQADCMILATGYTYAIPDFIAPVKEMINFDEQGHYNVAANYSIDKTNNRIFVQNAELHTHGFNTPDLSLGPYRNGIILNSITGKELFKFGDSYVFQQF
ncbi:MAG TPA: SidA/IucD/PvdA family monooxygenase [Parafilimonas sp.]|nr:SidA/IucD/PvdA family monooxygenase [Parafilimonas sp.]